MKWFKKKTTEEIIEETKRTKALLEALKTQNKVVGENKKVKKELREQKREAFENTFTGTLLKGLKKEVLKKSEANKKKFDSKNKKEEKYISPLLRD